MRLLPSSTQARLRLAMAGIVSLVGIGYFISLNRDRSVESDRLVFPQDFDPPLSSKTEMEIAALEESIRQNPPNATMHTRLGQAYLQKARAAADPAYLSKAEALFTKALELDVSDFQAIAGIGSICLSKHQFRDAITWGERGIAINPWSSDLYGILGDANVE